MPVPPPTLPSATGPLFAPSSAANDVLGLHVEAVDVVEVAVPGLGHDRRRPPVAGCVRLAVLTRQAIVASRTTPTLCVLVIITGPSSSPDSSIQVVPVISPLPLSANQPANTGVVDRSRARAAGSR